ncbi:MAG: hypothetical protein LKI59_07760, partial [Bacteroidales bacterium]|jgi:hypothetical protein|nr:hypothetical protein [Bacteroidales bacterium]
MGLRPKLNKLKNKPEQVSPKNAGRNVQTTLRKNVQRMFAYYTLLICLSANTAVAVRADAFLDYFKIEY